MDKWRDDETDAEFMARMRRNMLYSAATAALCGVAFVAFLLRGLSCGV